MLVGRHSPAKSRPSRAFQQSLFSLLQNCKTLKKLTQIHAQIITNNLSHKSCLLVKVLSLYFSFEYPQNALRAFSEIEKPSTTVWNQIIRYHARGDTPYRSFELFNWMVGGEVVPDGYTYSFVITGCVRCGGINEGKQIHARVIVNGFGSNLFVGTNLVNFYAGGREGVGDAWKVFNEMGERNVVTWNTLLACYLKQKDVDGALGVFDTMPTRNVVSWTMMISGCAENDRCKQAVSIFHEMQRENVELDQVAMVAALSACAELGDLELGMWIHSYVLENYFFKNEHVQTSLNNALIHMYASCGRIEEAYKVFLGMTNRTVVSWTSMITGYAKQGQGEEALRIFYWMLCELDYKPDEITFLGVLSACSHSGFVNQGRQIFENMKRNWGIEPKIEHYGCFVDLLSRAGFLDEACRVVEAMPIKPNDAIYGAILGGCIMHKNVELGSRIAQKLVAELDPDRAAGYLVPLANMYATGMRWQDAAKMREKVAEMGAKKPPGRSWVQIEGVVHEFYAYDMTQEHRLSLFKVLGEITAHAKGEENALDFLENLDVPDVSKIGIHQ